MSNIHFDFTGKSVVVTGGAQGIGLEITSQFLRAGASVAVWDYSADALTSAQAQLQSFAQRAQFMRVDVTQIDSIDAAKAKLNGPVDILVNNAGITRDKSLAKMTHDDFNAVIQTNLTGLFNVTKALLDCFTGQTKRIINLASVVALYGNFGQTNYVAAKAGVIGMTKTWSRELARKGWTVNAIAPGFVATAMTKAMPDEVLTAITAKVPAGRMAAPADIAQSCLFLASSEASYITGTVLSVDGGLVL